MAVMGGMRVFWGPLVGAAVFVVLQDYISSMTVNWMCFVGLIFVLVVLFFPRGLLGMLQRREARMSRCWKSATSSKHFGSLRRGAATCRCRWRRANCAPSSARTAPARPRSST